MPPQHGYSIFISQINSTSSSSTTPSRQCSYHFSFLSKLCLSHNFQWNNFVTVSCLLWYSHCDSFLHSHHIFYTVDFPMSCHLYSLYDFPLMLVLQQHISLLQFAPSDHFITTISKISFDLLLTINFIIISWILIA